jgi:peptidoglycan/xylan/chitin deacetylase (PgdA/CDA1 family)
VKGISILMYHQVGVFHSPRSHRSTFCHVERFRAQMAYLHRLRYRVLTLSAALETLARGTEPPSRAVVLTFDDGYQNFRQHAFPVLERYEFPATVFLVSGLLGSNARWLEADGRYGPPLMDRDTLRELNSRNVQFGGHGVSHCRLSRAAPDQMRREVTDSKAALEDLLGEEVRHFCYPYGDFDARVRQTVREAGYRAALTCIRGAATAADDPYVLPRKGISYGDNLIGYAWKLHMKNRKKLADQKTVGSILSPED